MDSKTYEYMKERTRKYGKIQDKITALRRTVESLKEIGVPKIYIHGLYHHLPSGCKEQIKEICINAIRELEKQQEEI